MQKVQYVDRLVEILTSHTAPYDLIDLGQCLLQKNTQSTWKYLPSPIIVFELWLLLTASLS